jgi:NAD(P)-dependent dehydrogenase (short-subunit alcohol dehydrogenase family)
MFTTMPSVLVTGAARGIGRAITARLAGAGWDVHAGVRRDEDGAALRADHPTGVHPLQLEITSADDIAALDERLPASLDAVVNNAGIVVGGPVEGVPLHEWRRQFDVNLFGQVAVAQAVLPRLRASRGRVVFISSVSGRVATPMTGPYIASKFALEGMADSLRLELAPWRIRVSLIEPAQTDTDFWRTADTAYEDAIASMSEQQRELYARHISGWRKVIPLSQRLAAPADTVAAAVERALTARRPRARYVVGVGPKIQRTLAALSPTPLRDATLRLATGVPRKV